MNIRKLLFPKVFPLVGLILSPLIAVESLAQPSDPPLSHRYRQAIQDAALVEEGENVSGLIEINSNNNHLVWNEDRSKILVVTWKSTSSYEKHIKPFTQTVKDEKHPIWVTVAPQLQDFCQKYLQANPQATPEELATRIKQYLGLAPDWSYDIFVEMWVHPKDLVRPCVDHDPRDDQCQLAFDKSDVLDNPKRKPEEVKGQTPGAKIEDYQRFFYILYFNSIRSSKQPWTGLGYTYDWGNPIRPVGASEFILIPGAEYTVETGEDGPKNTLKYCQAE